MHRNFLFKLTEKFVVLVKSEKKLSEVECFVFLFLLLANNINP